MAIIMIDTCSAMVYGDYLKNKDEVHDVLPYFFDTEIVALRGEIQLNLRLY